MSLYPSIGGEGPDVEESAAVAIARDLMSHRVAERHEMLSARRVDSPPSAEWFREKFSDVIARFSAEASARLKSSSRRATSRVVKPHWDVLFLVHDDYQRYGPIGLAMLAVDVDEESGERDVVQSPL